MKTCLLSLGAGLLLAAAPVAATLCASTAECVRAVQQAQGDTRTLSADFVQVKHLSLLEEPIVSSGHLLLKRPDHVLVRIDKPQAATVRINNGQLDIPSLPERERRAIAMAPMAGRIGDLGAIFSGSVEGLEEKFDVTAGAESDGIAVRLVPREESLKQIFRTIELRFDGPQLLIHRIRLEDALGDHLEITLDHVQRNVDIPDSVFTAKDS